MGYTDAKGRPELVVHPDIIGSRAVYRPADEQSAAPKPVEQTPKQQARAELKRQIAQQRRGQRKAGDTTQG